MPRLVFLADSYADYFGTCFRTFYDRYGGDVLTICMHGAYPESSRDDGVRYHGYSTQVDALDTVKAFRPDFIVTCGWMHKSYLSIARYFSGKIRTICAIDNWFSGSAKQTLGSFYFRVKYRKCFSHCWVAGLNQFAFARALGFSPSEILNGLYTSGLESTRTEKRGYPPTLVYVGRLVPYKQPDLLANLFCSLSESERNAWKLEIYGQGDLAAKIQECSFVKLRGSIRYDDVPSVLVSAGAAILPSNGEHWGVALHDYANLALPIISTNQTGAAEQFLIHGSNGFRFDAKSKAEFRAALCRLCATSEQQRAAMGEISSELGSHNSPDLWCRRLLSIARD